MNRLPVELLNKIFLYIHQEDKVECMLVCSLWETTIKASCLFHTVRVSSLIGLDRLKEKMKTDPSIGAKIKRFVFDVKTECYSYDMNELVEIIPLLSSLNTFSIVNWDIPDEVRKVTQCPFYNSIQCASGFSSYSMALPLLQFNMCPNLTTLTLLKSDTKIIYSFLKNAPSLKWLTVESAYLDLEDFEIIHENTSSLISLRMITLEIFDTKINHSIMPATMITECIFTELVLETDKTIEDLLIYISKKYPNLNRFAFDTMESFLEDSADAWDPLLQILKPQLKSLSITSENQPKDQSWLLDEDDDWKLNHLELRVTLPLLAILIEGSSSNNMQLIQSLILQDMNLEILQGLHKFTSLQELKLIFSYKEGGARSKRTVDLFDILLSCPTTLKSLSLKSVKLKPYKDNSDTFPIETLTFDEVNLPMNTDFIISKHFPRLSTLKLRNIEQQSTRHFMMPNVDLSFFQYEKSDVKNKKISVSVTTIHDKSTCRYTMRDGNTDHLAYPPEFGTFDTPLYPPVKSLPENGIENPPYFTLTCNSLKRIMLRPKVKE